MWLYNNKEFTSDDIGDKIGFVYLIEDTVNDKLYVGKKLFHMMKTRQVKKKKKRYKAESDWQTYYGSNKDLQEVVSNNDSSKFKRTILHLCKTKGECNYLEAKEQFDRNVLLDEKYYNGWIACKVQYSHVKGLLSEGN